MNAGRLLLIAALAAGCSSCSTIAHNTVEGFKTVWGSSTRVLQEGRKTAVAKTYDRPYWDCFRASMAVAKKQHWVIFKKDEIQGYIVIMGIKGCVDTTEVGIFFEELSNNQIRIEISSLSTNAKRLTALALFHGLDIAFGYLPPEIPRIHEPAPANPTTDATGP
ncbi:MAG: hypothetical protein KGJ09_08555 [Candidatus Omnitrophica bacterium]|nr:hypothetical protein [Candidatus Omnitrophota bacterium]MDE2214299.1 hypothetical protein [Candidatus Omnitrophota bacterium]MDE2231048.1 hypothetical protein [Candidatus Omnitrophota bacterium]